MVKIQERYGSEKEQGGNEMDDFLRTKKRIQSEVPHH
jgi:hypothetical protein